MVLGKSIQKKQHPVSGGGVHYLVYPWEGKVVFKASIIEVSVVDVDSPFPPFFGDYNQVF